MGTWLSLFNNWETFGAQFLALVIVVGSYLGAQYLRVLRPRRHGRQLARFAERAPDRAADIAVGRPQLTNGFTSAWGPAATRSTWRGSVTRRSRPRARGRAIQS